jgi:hypothetical protein
MTGCSPAPGHAMTSPHASKTNDPSIRKVISQ